MKSNNQEILHNSNCATSVNFSSKLSGWFFGHRTRSRSSYSIDFQLTLVLNEFFFSSLADFTIIRDDIREFRSPPVAWWILSNSNLHLLFSISNPFCQLEQNVRFRMAYWSLGRKSVEIITNRPATIYFTNESITISFWNRWTRKGFQGDGQFSEIVG